jgi:ribonuclease HI
VDFRDLNRASPKDNFPLPHIDVLMDNAAKSSTYSFMDGFSGYNQIKMVEQDKKKTTFVTSWGTYCYRVMPFGLKNAGATYQREMVTLFHDMMHKEIDVYVDDMIAKSKDEENHIPALKKLFERLRTYQLKLNPAKCTFRVKSGKLLGFVVSNNGIEVDPDKVKAIQAMTAPKTEKEVRSFLGRLNYIARFISQLTVTCEPIFRLLRKKNPGVWDEDCQEAFDKIKQYLQNPPLLVPPVPGKPLILYLTVTESAMGCVLGQHDEFGRKEQVIYYLSKKFTECESHYNMIEKLCCGLVWSVKRLRQYMLYYTTWLISKIDLLKYIFEKPYMSNRLARWQVLLAEYDIIYKTRKSMKGSAIADHLADNAIEDYEPLNFDFPDEDVLVIESDWWTMYFDGAVNVYGNGAGAVIISPEGKQYPISIKLQFSCTNNTAEYEACIHGLEAALELKIGKLEVYGDSMLIICQTKGEWQTKDEKLKPYQEYLSKLAENFEEIEFNHLGRDKNQFADALATLASMATIDCGIRVHPIGIDIRSSPTHCCLIEEEVDGNPWYADIKRFIQYREYPSEASKTNKKTLRRMAMEYFIDGEILYKRSFDGTLLRCLDRSEANKALYEVHGGICTVHANGHMMARQMQRAGYFWMTMEKDCIEFVRKCHKCQVYSDKINAPQLPLFNMVSPWPFAMWGTDVVGPINLKASNGHRFILVAIDYFTKWVEACSYAHVTQKVVKQFIKRYLICRYGLPERIVIDNAKNFNGKMIRELCTKWKIKHSNSSPYRPKMNGAVEAANKNIKKIVQKMVVTYKDWQEWLPYALHAYRTAVRTSTGATPYSLVYGMEAVMSLKVEIPSLRVLMESELEEAKWAKIRYEQLNMINEKRLVAICHHQLYQNRIARAYDRKVRPREFKKGDLVLRKILLLPSENHSKWAPNYKGPYIVKKAFSGGALILTGMDGEDLSRPVNSDSVKKYYP